MKDGPLSKLTITKGGQRATQYKKIIDALPVFYANKGYTFINDIIRTGTERLQASFLPTYPVTGRWLNTYHVEVVTVDANALPDATTGRRPEVVKLQEKTHISNPNLQKRLLSEHDIQSKLQLGEWSKLLADKRSLMTIIYGQCDDATRTEIALGTDYETIRTNAELIRFLELVRKVCYGSDDGGLSFKPYKIVVAVKSMNNFTNNKPNDPHGFKEELKIKYDAVLAVVGKFPNGTGPMLELLKAETVPLDWAAYCAMSIADQESWERKGDACTKAMLILMNSKNDAAKRDLRLSYSQGNKKAYPETEESMARYLSTQYSNKLANNPRDKKGKNSKKGDDTKTEPSNTSTSGTAGAHVGETATPKDTTVPSKGGSIGAHVSETSQRPFRPARSVEELLAAHPVDDAIWSNSNPSDVSIDTANSAEILAGSHFTEDCAYAFERSYPFGLTDTSSIVSDKDDMSWYDGLAFLDNFTDSSESTNTFGDDVTHDSTSESTKSDFRIGKRQC